MVELTMIEGTWDEIANHASEFNGHRLRVTILPNGSHSVTGKMIVLGMFPELGGITDTDFLLAEFRGDVDDGLDWRE